MPKKSEIETLTDKELWARYCAKAGDGKASQEQVREELNEIFRRIPGWIKEK